MSWSTSSVNWLFSDSYIVEKDIIITQNDLRFLSSFFSSSVSLPGKDRRVFIGKKKNSWRKWAIASYGYLLLLYMLIWEILPHLSQKIRQMFNSIGDLVAFHIDIISIGSSSMDFYCNAIIYVNTGMCL